MKEIDWYMRRMVMKKKALILLTLCMVSLTACGTKESVKPVPATEQTAKAEPTEEVQEVTETQAQEVKKPEESNTRVIKGFRSRAVETANDDETYEIQYSLYGNWGNDKEKEIQNFRDTVKLIPFDESVFADGK